MSTVVTITVRPVCDVCQYVTGVTDEPAFFDARTHSGRWANLCYPCWMTETDQRLGTGFGQRLVVKGEK